MKDFIYQVNMMEVCWDLLGRLVHHSTGLLDQWLFSVSLSLTQDSEEGLVWGVLFWGPCFNSL